MTAGETARPKPVEIWNRARARPRARGGATVTLRLEALAHPVRLRLLRTLVRGPHTTGELAHAWELSALLR